MWFEARKQEKKLRNIMVDHKKRAERRRQFYERIKKDPAEFMQIHGRQYKIYLEPSVAQAAESPAILRPWQGDQNIFIDRFDARSHLDFIPEIKNKPHDEISDSDASWDERQSSYERYRILVLNEFEKMSEDKFLKQIYMEENFGQPINTLVKSEEEKKKKLADQKAAIAFKYEDVERSSSNVKTKYMENNDATLESDESSDSEDSEPDIDKRLDVNELSNEECKELNSIAMKYQMQMGDFVKYTFLLNNWDDLRCLWEDHDELEHLQTIQVIEGEKAAMAGKHSRRERKIIKEMKIRERGLIENPLGILRVEEPKLKRKASRSSSSSSSSDSSNAPLERIQYITSFGGADSDGEGHGLIQGPAPPPFETKKSLQELHRPRSSSRDKFIKKEISKPKTYMRHNRTPSRSRSRSRNRSRRRRSSSRQSNHRSSASKGHSSASRRRSGSRSSKRRSRSKGRSSSSRSRSRRHRSSSRKRRTSPDRQHRYSTKTSVTTDTSTSKSKSRSLELSRLDDKDARQKANGKTTNNQSVCCVKNSLFVEKQQQRAIISSEAVVVGGLSPVFRSKSPSSPLRMSDDNASDLSTMSLRSDMSDSEQERRQVENTRRRLKKTKRNLQNRRRSQSSNESSNLISASTKPKPVSSIVDKLKLQTQKALKRTLAKDKEEERQRQEEILREQIEREDELREMAILLRKKEREKYLAEQVERQNEIEKSSSSRESRKHRSRSRSKSRSHDRHKKHSKRHKSRSRSRSKSKTTKKLVDY